MMKSEKGAVTVFVLVVMLFFTVVLMGVLVATNNAKKTQSSADTTIIDAYQKDVDLVNEIYNEKVKQLNQINRVLAKWDESTISYLTTTTATINAYINIYDKSADLEECKYIISNSNEKIGTNSNDWNNGTVITAMNGTISNINVQTGRNYYIHILITETSGNKYEYLSNKFTLEEQQLPQANNTIENNTINNTIENNTINNTIENNTSV